jgi:acetyl esterase/lipase
VTQACPSANLPRVEPSLLGTLAHHPLFVPSAYLGASAAGAAFALNARRPLVRGGRLSIPVFFAGWLTAELPLHHLAWQLAATVAFAWAGALASWPGWLGLGIMLASWAGLIDLFVQARQAEDIVERALLEALGTGYQARIAPALRERFASPPGWLELLRPFAPGRPGVERIRNLSYGAHGRRNRLDVYRPKGGPGGRPVIVQVHGGAWIVGDKQQQGLPLVYTLAAQGWVCVSINYRLSPRSTFPDHIVDVKRALAWVKAHIAEYGGDPDFVVITGGSAGGHLASLAALTAGDPELQPGFEDADTSVAACVPFYGVYDFTNRSGVGRPDLRGLLERLVMKKPFAEARAAYDRASPMSHVSAEAPPFLVIHGANDTLVPVAEARFFVELLRKASRAPVAYVELPQAQHAFEVFTSLRTAHVVRGVARFLAYVYSEHLAQGRGEAAALPARVEATEEVQAEVA